MYNMLTSTSQYLQPDYLQPLPTTLDAKKSPLALLAQTCSSIGKDPTPTKPLIPPIGKKESEKEKSEKLKTPENKRPNSEETKGSGRDSEEKPGFRTIPNKEIPPLVPISSSSSDKHSSPAPVSESKSNEGISVSRPTSRPVSSGVNSSSVHNSSRSSSGTYEKDRANRESPSSAPKARGSPDHPKSASHPSYSSLGLPAFPQGYPGFPLMSHGIPVDSASHSIGYPASLMAPAGLGLSSASAAAAAAAAAAQTSSALKHASAASCLSPYVTYARVRTPSGATTLVPVCRDPYCTNCQLTLQNSHSSSQCNAPGCSQCAHEKSLQSLTSGLGPLGVSSLQMLPNYSSAGGLTGSAAGLSSLHSMSSLYPHSALAAHQGLPFVCNWVTAGNEYCGKRFTSSEELLQHLRTHTTVTDAAQLAATYSGLGFSPAAAALAGCHAQLSAPGGLSPNSLRRSYPTSLSPVSSLLGASRYHPYKSALPGAPAPLAPQSLPTLGPYYSPYALYGQRIGAAAVP